jgi:hypothetical protein
MPCKFRPARRARGKRPHSRRLCRLSIYTDTLGVHAWSVRSKTVEKTVCVNGANIWKAMIITTEQNLHWHSRYLSVSFTVSQVSRALCQAVHHPHTGFHYSRLRTYLSYGNGSFSNISGMDLVGSECLTFIPITHTDYIYFSVNVKKVKFHIGALQHCSPRLIVL